MTTVTDLLKALADIGLKDATLFEDWRDGDVCVSLNRLLDEDGSTLLPFPDTNPDDPE